MTRAFFITGTDTGVGKTLVAAALLHGANATGARTLGLKPVAAGGQMQQGQFVNEDAWQLKQLSTVQPNYADVNPVALKAAIAPHIAAEQEGVFLSAESLATHCRSQAETADFCVIEGAGGWCVPLNASETMADLAVAIGYPVILTVGVRLGCINHTLVSVAAIEHSGLTLAGWVANEIDPNMPVIDENIATLKTRLTAPLLGRIPWDDTASAAVAASCLSMEKL
jgi:dethiobiotin synthetase